MNHNPNKPHDWGNGKYVFEMFPQEMIDLNIELSNPEYHPKLAQILGRYPDDEVDIKLAHIASYCEVMLDGEYTLENRIQLCKILKEKLVLLREKQVSQSIIVLGD